MVVICHIIQMARKIQVQHSLRGASLTRGCTCEPWLPFLWSSTSEHFCCCCCCTCPGDDHPGLTNEKGHGTLEINILEAEYNKHGTGHIISQSAQFPLFTHNYLNENSTLNQWTIHTPDITWPDTHKWAPNSIFFFLVRLLIAGHLLQSSTNRVSFDTAAGGYVSGFRPAVPYTW